jgi:polyphosphate glucokinase
MTPRPASPQKVVSAIEQLASGFQEYDKISIGFPGLVKKGITYTAPNLNSDLWKGVDLYEYISRSLGKPVRIINDADMQGLGVSGKKGVEMVITLGTGFGSALLLNGQLLPHIELAHHTISKN